MSFGQNGDDFPHTPDPHGDHEPEAEPVHCDDCCCARSWKALGVDEYTGKSIPEHIAELIAEVERYKADILAVTGRCDRLTAQLATAREDERERCAGMVHSAARPFVDGLKTTNPLEAGAAWAVCDDIADAIRALAKLDGEEK